MIYLGKLHRNNPARNGSLVCDYGGAHNLKPASDGRAVPEVTLVTQTGNISKSQDTAEKINSSNKITVKNVTPLRNVDMSRGYNQDLNGLNPDYLLVRGSFQWTLTMYAGFVSEAGLMFAYVQPNSDGTQWKIYGKPSRANVVARVDPPFVVGIADEAKKNFTTTEQLYCAVILRDEIVKLIPSNAENLDLSRVRN